MKINNKFIIYFLLTTISFIVAFPFIWLLITSFKTTPQMYKFPIEYIPFPLTLSHYRDVLINHDFFIYFRNSIIISTITSLGSVIISVLPAYAISRFMFSGKRILTLSLVVTQMFPPVLSVIPFFLLLRRLALVNNFFGMMLVYLPFTVPVSIWMIINFYNKVPIELEESAHIDGCNRFQIFSKITLPLVIPGVASVGIYTFLFSWGELMLSLSYLTDKNKQTLPVLLSKFIGQYNTRWGQMFAGAVISTIPAIIMFTVLQRYFVEGLTAGSIKG